MQIAIFIFLLQQILRLLLSTFYLFSIFPLIAIFPLSPKNSDNFLRIKIFKNIISKHRSAFRFSTQQKQFCCSTRLNSASLHLVRVGRIELPSHPWQGRVLPLNHTRNFFYYRALWHFFYNCARRFLCRKSFNRHI